MFAGYFEISSNCETLCVADEKTRVRRSQNRDKRSMSAGTHNYADDLGKIMPANWHEKKTGNYHFGILHVVGVKFQEV